MSNKATVKELLEDRFRELAQQRRENNDVPAALREEVFDTLEKVEEVDDVSELLNVDLPAEVKFTTGEDGIERIDKK